MKNFTIVAPHAVRQAGEDIIFGMSRRANEAAAKIGSENVINATIGALMDDEGKLITLKNVFEVYRNLPDAELSAYAGLKGMPSFLESIPRALFKDYIPNAYIDSVATPGGSGAIRHAIWNFSNAGDYVLTSDWYWAPYQTLATENLRKIATYPMTNEDESFNVNGFLEKSSELLKEQKRLLAIINAPAHNPTGFSLSYDEWDAVIKGLKELAKNSDYVISILIDAAYIDYCTMGDKAREFFNLLTDIPDNLMFLVAFSMSKGYTMYGMRCGAIVGVTSSKSNLEAFTTTCTFSGRGTWSNGTRGAMVTMGKIFSDEKLLEKVDEERNIYRKQLVTRAHAFDTKAKEIGLKSAPYKDGFFISIPCDNPKLASEKLMEKNAYLVPLAKGLRFAVCAVDEVKCSNTPKIIKEVLDSL